MPAALARRTRAAITAGMVPLPGRAMPSASDRQFIELAVNMPRAGAARGAGFAFHAAQPLLVQLARAESAHGLKDGVEILPAPSGQHGAAGHHDGGHVDARGRHQHAGHDLVAVGNQHERVKAVGLGERFDAVGDELARHQRIVHSLMPHGDAVAHGDGGHLHRRTAGHAHAFLDRLGDGIQVHMAGHDFALRVDHADQGAVQLGVDVTHGLEQASVRSPGKAGFDGIAFHGAASLPVRLTFSSSSSCAAPRRPAPPARSAPAGGGR